MCFIEIGEPKLPYIYSLGTFVTWPVISSRREWYWRGENSDSSVSVVCLSFWMHCVCCEEVESHCLSSSTQVGVIPSLASSHALTYTQCGEQSSRTCSNAGEVPSDQGFGLDDPQRGCL